ncbi:MAG: rod shape-determining protein MreD [Alphaproteobacteria bacterium ADurb.Bin438]|nr:MAG: rod shape-determining protein MreD [Alphaproteobacteria bacterium ADurb.Bin438]
MQQSFGKFKESKAYNFLLKISPIIMILFIIFIEHAPVYFSYFSFIRPQISLIVVFFWSVYFPESLGIFSVFLLGLLSDLLFNSVLGLSAFLFLLMYVLLSEYKNFLTNRSFSFVYVIFSFVMFCASLIKYLIMTIENNSLPPLMQEVVSYAMIMCFYPFFVYFLGKFNMYLIGRSINVDK